MSEHCLVQRLVFRIKFLWSNAVLVRIKPEGGSWNEYNNRVEGCNAELANWFVKIIIGGLVEHEEEKNERV